jgi:GNAT superfamily N-acetyltransferase
MAAFENRACAAPDLAAVSGLFKLSFPAATHLTPDYLRWLFFENPVGEAVGRNIWDGDRLVAHVAGVPQRAVIHGRPETIVLLVNVATHPDHRGKGLFLDVIRQTVEAARRRGYAAVTGVANAQTIRAYEQKLGFQNVAGLSAHVELLPQRIDFTAALARGQFHRVWDDATLAWRLRSPANPLRIARATADGLIVEGASTMRGVRARGAIPRGELTAKAAGGWLAGPAVVLGLVPAGAARRRLGVDVPRRLRPSPLRLIYQRLEAPWAPLDPERVLFSFLDFDAF